MIALPPTSNGRYCVLECRLGLTCCIARVRSLLLSLFTMLPSFALQLVATPIMEAIGVRNDIASDVGLYSQLMILSALLLLLEIHLETVLVNLGYVCSATFNSFVTGKCAM